MNDSIVYCFLDEEDYEAVSGLVCAPDVRIVPLSCPDWNRDLSPWAARKVFPDGEDFSGGADAYLADLLNAGIPAAESGLASPPERRYLAGYSLAGLFAVYAATRTGRFDGVASVSGSIWFDGFTEYLESHPMDPRIRRVYFSLGDKEKNSREPRMKTVEDRTEAAYETIRRQGIESVFEHNPGGHFHGIPERIANGIRWLIREEST